MIDFQDTYRELPKPFFSLQSPTPVKSPGLIAVNEALAKTLKIDPNWLRSEDGVAVLSGNRILDNAETIATKYGGHQFGNWNPQLGDGRAVLLGEVLSVDNQRFDVQLKGAGPTPYSRGGDGRSPIGPVIREYIVSEAMAALGVPTTRALAAVTTGEDVRRTHVAPGAILTRVAKSHIRVGTFEYFSDAVDLETFRSFVHYVIDRHYPMCRDDDNPIVALLSSVLERQAHLIARWQLLGFIHGVMNTDNMLVCGETVDYGPCAFMDNFEMGKVFSSIDRHGRYAYNNQPLIGQWNIAQFASTLIPLIDDDRSLAIATAQSIVDTFPDVFSNAFQQRFNRKIGLGTVLPDDDALMTSYFSTMEKAESDFTLTFRALDTTDDRIQYPLPDAFKSWIDDWENRMAEETTTEDERREMMDAENPFFIPRNHRVEAAIDAAESGDYAPFHRLTRALSDPYNYREEFAELLAPPKRDEIVHKTFCGT